MLIGYARVSAHDQSLVPQEEALRGAGCLRVFTDIACGASSERPGLKRALSSAKDGDTLVVVSLDRLACSLTQLVKTVAALQQQGLGLKSLEDEIDTTSRAGEQVTLVFSALAAFERALAREKTQRGRKSARARGRLGGRPPALDEEKRARVVELHKDPSVSPGDICRTLNISKTTLYRYLATSGGQVDASKD